MSANTKLYALTGFFRFWKDNTLIEDAGWAQESSNRYYPKQIWQAWCDNIPITYGKRKSQHFRQSGKSSGTCKSFAENVDCVIVYGVRKSIYCFFRHDIKIICMEMERERGSLLRNHNEDATVFKAFCDVNRLQILEILRSGEKCACVLLESLQISQSTLSYHMKILCDSGIVTSRNVGKWTYYQISESGSKRAMELLRILTQKNDTKEEGYNCSDKCHQ